MKMIAGKLAINNRAFLAVLTLVGVARLYDVLS